MNTLLTVGMFAVITGLLTLAMISVCIVVEKLAYKRRKGKLDG